MAEATPVLVRAGLAAALLAAVGLGLTATPGLAVAGTTSAQDRCLPPGTAITPVPWSQRLLAPDRAWALSSGAGQQVAVVSTGVADTPFLAGAVAGRTDVAPPPSFGEPSGEVDCLGLGTATAGIIAGRPTDGIGFHGVAPDAMVLDAKVVGDQFPSGREPGNTVAPGRLARGIEWAVGEGATVIVVATATYEDSDALRAAATGAIDAGIVVVASVGDGTNDQELSDLVPYPAGYDGVIGVGALSPDGTALISWDSHVDLVAPGADLVVPYPRGGLGPAGGTGFAAAYVAGTVALVRAYRPDLSPAEVAQRLFATAAPAPEGVGSTRYGYGIVSPGAAVADRVVDGRPAGQPPYRPVVISEEERARQAAQARADALAGRLVLIGLGVAVVVAVGMVLGARARRHRWRAGLATLPVDRPASDDPEPPRELFSET